MVRGTPTKTISFAIYLVVAVITALLSLALGSFGAVIGGLLSLLGTFLLQAGAGQGRAGRARRARRTRPTRERQRGPTVPWQRHHCLTT